MQLVLFHALKYNGNAAEPRCETVHYLHVLLLFVVSDILLGALLGQNFVAATWFRTLGEAMYAY